MVTHEIKCIKCDGFYTQERGKGAKPINTSHICDKCVADAVKQDKADIKAEKAEAKAERAEAKAIAADELWESEKAAHIKHT
jgi:hypothetical protein